MHKKVLLIDDSPPIHPLVTALLGDEFVAIYSAFDGQSGLTLASTLQPDLILLDVEMPGIDGFETCRRLKADPQTIDIPVIFLTARAGADDRALAAALGAVGYVLKPISLPELLSSVHDAIDFVCGT